MQHSKPDERERAREREKLRENRGGGHTGDIVGKYGVNATKKIYV